MSWPHGRLNFMVNRLAMLSMHSSPLLQPGQGDSGGMNVYVRELSGSLARAGVPTDVYVRRTEGLTPEVVEVEPGVRVIQVEAGPHHLAKEDLLSQVGPFAAGVGARLRADDDQGVVLHANYWLSGVAGHELKHALDVPLIATFHTLDRVKAQSGLGEVDSLRARREAEVIGCCDAVLASCGAEADQLVELYDCPRDRIELISPGVDHAFFSTGDRSGARTAVGLDHADPVVLFVGRIQPLKGLGVAVEALASMRHGDARLVVIGGASGPDGQSELDRVHGLIADRGLTGRVEFVDPQPHHLLAGWYRAADVGLVPSRTESFGLVALEAAACGLPVVASAVGGLTSLVDHRRTGVLVEGRDPSDYASAIDHLLDDDRRRLRMGSAAAMASADYTWPLAAARLRRLAADLTQGALVSCAA